MPGIASGEFVGPLAGEKNLVSVRSAGPRNGEQCGITVMMGGAVKMPDTDRPQSEVVLAGNRHRADRDVDVATDPRSLRGLTMAGRCVSDIADDIRVITPSGSVVCASLCQRALSKAVSGPTHHP